MNLSKILESINYTKEDALADNDKDYVPFVVNRSLSYFIDTIAYANQMNLYPHLNKRLQYDYLRNAIRKKRRFSKWAKKAEYDCLEAVCFYYGCSKVKAIEIINLLSQEQKSHIQSEYEKLQKT
jgi:hypothetical protein